VIILLSTISIETCRLMQFQQRFHGLGTLERLISHGSFCYSTPEKEKQVNRNAADFIKR
jgi:hypothetical protein